MPLHGLQRREMSSAELISQPFSLDRVVDESIPPGVPLTYVKVAGPMSYCATLPVKHGDYLGLIPDTDDNPDAILLVRIGPSYFIRKRSTINWMIRRFSMHLLGQVPKKRNLLEVIGLVFMVCHFPPGSAVNAATVPHADPPAAVASLTAGKPRRFEGGDDENGGGITY